MPDELDQLALDVANDIDESGITEPYDIVTFARRYRAALAEKMKPVAYLPVEYYSDKKCVPLYSLEDWK